MLLGTVVASVGAIVAWYTLLEPSPLGATGTLAGITGVIIGITIAVVAWKVD
ncbi:MAG: hypothetical protein QFX35_03875 [Candidatus Verstraetearchaeota archaeon]|nr:hypothetical protein [Candidatus Verstraetearchaeota archaeon]